MLSPRSNSPKRKALVADNLLTARRIKRATQVEVAAAIGSTQDQVSRWERGVCSPGVKWTQPLADYFFGGDLARLLGPDNTVKRPAKLRRGSG